jgi:uncharacterized protein YkwD
LRPVRLITVCSLFVLVFAALPASASANADGDRMIGHINQVRAAHNLRPLRTSPALIRSAGRFSLTMMSSDRFGHGGRIQASGFRRLGEALAMHFGRGVGISRTVRGWLRSPSHRAIVLTRSMRYVGAAATRGRFRGRRAVIWVLQTGG